jgi:hypothetical protein
MANDPTPGTVPAAVNAAQAALDQRNSLWQQIDDAVAAAVAELDIDRNTADAAYSAPKPVSPPDDAAAP